MRIVHTLLRYPPATGGVESYVREIVTRTRSVPDKRDIRVLTSKMRTHGPISTLNPELLLDDPMYVQRLHHAATPFISYPRLQALKYYLSHHQPDIIHGYGFWYQPADVAARFAAKHKIPFIFHPIYYENAVRRKVVWQLYKKTIGAKTFAAADVVVVISLFEQSLIEKAGFTVKRFELIPPGIDASSYQQPRLNPFIKRKISGPILLAVNRLAASKGLATLIEALPAILSAQPEAQVALVGEDFGAKKELRAQAQRLGVEKSIHWLGKLSGDELKAAYQHADIFIHTSYYEAFGIVLAEAMASGTPVVARNVAAVPYVVPDQQAGMLFTTGDQLVSQALTLLGDDKLRAKMGQAGKRHVETNFTWDSSIKKILGLYEEFSR